MGDPSQVFKPYDVRGIVPAELDERLCRAVGVAFARFSGATRLIVARDMRRSSPELCRAFVEGATGEGASVTDLGLASTDMLYFASGRLDAPGAVFTASHNPAEYNGIKLCRAGARPVGQDSGLVELQRLTLDALEEGPSAARPPGSVEHLDLLGEYATHVRSFVDEAALRPLRVVADVANGMGGLVVPPVFAPLPVELEVLFPELDGSFPNHPADPIQEENLADLRRRVLETGADMGMAFDGDADRVFLIDDRAQPVSGSVTTALVARAMLERHPGATILHNLICSRMVPEVITESGGKPVRTRVGHSFIKAVMADTGAVFGGEHSGHYYFQDNYRADSGLIAAVLVLEVVSKAGRPLSELRRPLERYAATGEINSRVEDPEKVIEKVAAHFAPTAKEERLDGLSVDVGDWWFNLRPSNTEPLLRLNLEAVSEERRDAGAAEVLALIRG
ncbi:MAG: phosphomannomutase/phosphoglucomutase, partial [Acidimicrobiales bacterium]|nr:phosphomannomutase/phosphoglucomutase [Acidimicrobiales bacterium]